MSGTELAYGATRIRVGPSGNLRASCSQLWYNPRAKSNAKERAPGVRGWRGCVQVTLPALRGTDLAAFAATCLRACYAMSGTELTYAATHACCAMSCADIVYAATSAVVRMGLNCFMQ
eukprot:1438649-Rhodomonas_salina.2